MLGLLEEARWRLLRIGLLFAVGAFTASFFVEEMVRGLLTPATTLGVTFITTSPAEKFTVYFKICLLAGGLVSLPYLVFELWLFLRPALRAEEARFVKIIIAYIAVASALMLAVFIKALAPAMLSFFVEFEKADGVQAFWRMESYIDLIVLSALATWTVVFFPIVLVTLSRVGIVARATLARYRTQAIVASLLLAGIITPSTDIASQLVLGGILYALFEASLVTLRILEARNQFSTEKEQR